MDAAVSPKLPIVLVVDDEERIVQLFEGVLHAKGYATLAARNGREALALAAEKRPDLIIIDAMMPDIDGFETVARLKADPVTRPVPVIMVTALNDRESKLRALNAGAEEYLTKPVDIADLAVRARNMLRLKEYGDLLLNYNRSLEERVKERTAQVEEAHRDTILTLARAAEYKDEETGYHVQRIGEYCRLLASELGTPGEFVVAIHLSSPMHDIGKIGIPDEILLKQGGLTSEEWAIMKTHSVMGSRVLAVGRSPYTLTTTSAGTAAGTQTGVEAQISHWQLGLCRSATYTTRCGVGARTRRPSVMRRRSRPSAKATAARTRVTLILRYWHVSSGWPAGSGLFTTSMPMHDERRVVSD